MKTLITSILAAAVLAAAPVVAQDEKPKSDAIVTEIVGSVLVNQGEQFVPALDGMELKEGDRVMAMSESGALIKYEDGCDVRVEPDTVVTLDEGSPCAGWLLGVERVAPAGLALGAGATTGLSPWIYVPAIALGGVILYDEFDDDDPVSP
ncbi:MAG: hypothetical protein WCY72_07175 [Lysobacteraceae bacterium]